MRVVANQVQSEHGPCLDILVSDELATVDDLAAACAVASNDRSLPKQLRLFPTVEASGDCFGCTYCCHRFSIFISRIDVLRLAAREDCSPQEFLAYFSAYEPWKVDRVRLADPARYCLQADDEGCGKYPDRPLVCRLFICCHHTERARQLIGEVNRLAEQELLNWRSEQPDSSNPFTEKLSYDQVLLKDCVSEELWRALFRPPSLGTGETQQGDCCAAASDCGEPHSSSSVA